jgi:hypothetical protein
VHPMLRCLRPGWPAVWVLVRWHRQQVLQVPPVLWLLPMLAQLVLCQLQLQACLTEGLLLQAWVWRGVRASLVPSAMHDMARMMHDLQACYSMVTCTCVDTCFATRYMEMAAKPCLLLHICNVTETRSSAPSTVVLKLRVHK